MLELYLIRHAETFEKTPHQADWQRELTPKGRSDSIHLGKYLMSQKIKLDAILCSQAERTQTTSKLIAESLSLHKERIIPLSTLYQATIQDMLHIVKGIDKKFRSVAIVGHNPTISAFANGLSKKNTESFSPCTLAAFQFPLANWSQIDLKAGHLLFIKQPPIL